VSVVLTDDQVEFQSTVRSFLEKRFREPVSRLRESPDDVDDESWRAFAGLELLGLGVPEELHGSGGSLVELGLVLEEMGAALTGTPFLATTLASQALATLAPPDLTRTWMDAIREGSCIATLSLPVNLGRWDELETPVLAEHRGDGWVLTGVEPRVMFGHVAHVVVSMARTPDGPGLFLTETGQAGLTATAVPTMDPTRPMASVTFEDATATLVALCREGWQGDARRVLDIAAAALAAEQLGGARRCLQDAVEYATVRFQHGQAIGSFQAIKHRCADVFIGCEAARSVGYHALSVASSGTGDLATAATVARIAATTAYTNAAEASIQIHGAIGFTQEHPAHLFLKRAKSSEVLLGDLASQRERLAQCLEM
jgi:alkylation response protein AidB-like acyl-CoA dehydrogenase